MFTRDNRSTDMTKRVYKEDLEQEMNIWVMINNIKTSVKIVQLVVTVFRKYCDLGLASFSHCGDHTEVLL